MTDPHDDPHNGDDFNQTIDASPEDTPRQQTRGWSRRSLVGGAAVGFVIGAGILAATGFGYARSGFMHGHHGMMGGFAEYRLEKAIESVDATEDQQRKIKAIFNQARTEVAPQMRGFRETREALAGLIEAPTIDRAAIEKLRAERIAAVDAASKRIATAIADAAEVLTPEQRKELVTEMREHAERRW